jgi:hypothetical protein
MKSLSHLSCYNNLCIFPYPPVVRLSICNWNTVDVRTNLMLSFVVSFFFLKLVTTISCIRLRWAPHIMNQVTHYFEGNWSCLLVSRIKREISNFPETSVNISSLQSHKGSAVFLSVQLGEPLIYHDNYNILTF